MYIIVPYHISHCKFSPQVVKSWDFQQFLSMGKEQRTAIRRALNEDSEKLIQVNIRKK